MIVDSNGLLTILGLMVAVIAVLPKSTKLDFLLKLNLLDWLIIIACILLIHYISFFPVLHSLGLTVDLGYWKWGFNSKNTTYLIFLFLVIYVVLRVKYANLTKRNIKDFEKLFERLLIDKQYDELSILLERYFSNLVKIHNNISVRDKVAKKIRPPLTFHIALSPELEEDVSFIHKKFPQKCNSLANTIESPSTHKKLATSIIKRLLNSPDFVSFLATSRIDLCLQILIEDVGAKDDFLQLFFSSLIANRTSSYYYELEDNQYTQASHRYLLPNENKLLYLLFNDVEVAENLGVYKHVGGEVGEIIDYDLKIINRYNEPLGIYYHKLRNRCPIDVSLHFFDIMVLESMHQGIKWHMWLYYFPTFSKKILNKLNPDKNVDLTNEFPTPFHYLLYRIVTIPLDWLNEFDKVEKKENLLMENEELCHDNGSIPKSAALAIGDIVNQILMSENIQAKFKIYIVEIVMRSVRDFSKVSSLEPISRILSKSILFNGFRNETNCEYLHSFHRAFQEIDSMILFDLKDFNEFVEKTIRDEC